MAAPGAPGRGLGPVGAPRARILVGDGPRRRPHDRRRHLPDARRADRRARVARADARPLARLRRAGPRRRLHVRRARVAVPGGRRALRLPARGVGRRESPFLYGWQSLLVMDPGVTAALALGRRAATSSVLWPAAAGTRAMARRSPRSGSSRSSTWRASALSARALNVLTAFKVARPRGASSAARSRSARGSWSHFSPFGSRAAPGAPPLAEALGLGLIGAFYSFGGFWEASRVAGEMRDPRRQLPRALGARRRRRRRALYVLTTLAFLYLVPAEQATDAGGVRAPRRRRPCSAPSGARGARRGRRRLGGARA